MNALRRTFDRLERATARLWKIIVYQVLIAVAVFAAWRVLQSPSTMGFFVFELGVALATGFFLRLRVDVREGPSSPRGVRAPASKPEDSASKVTEKGGTRDIDAKLGSGVLLSDPRSRGRRVFLVLSCFYFVVLGLAFLDLSRSLYAASLQFYVLVAIGAGVLAANVYLSGETRVAPLLTQIVILAALLKYHFQFLNPTAYTSDSFLFYNGLLAMAATGRVPVSLGHYYFFPGFATFAYAGSTIAGVPLELFSAFASLSQIVMIPLVYLLGRYLTNRRMGLFASLFVVFAIYTFLFTQTGPAYYGIAFVFLAIYAAMRTASEGGREWFVIFWFAAITALFSHPVNALILALILALRALTARTARGTARQGTPSVAPALSYAVAYGAYLVFAAYTAFDLFVRSFLVVDYAPPLATVPVPALERSQLFVYQSALAPLGLAIPVFFAAFAILARGGISKSEHRFLVVLGAVFLLIPGTEFLGENFKLQSSRMLVYLAVPLVLLAAFGLMSFFRPRAISRPAAAGVLVLFFVLGFVASSSYLAQDDSRAVYTDVPATPAHITLSALAERQYLNLTPRGSTIFLDFASSRYFANSDRSRFPLSGHTTPDLAFFQQDDGSGFVVLDEHYMAYGMPSSGTFYDIGALTARLGDQPSARLYDSGTISIYYVP
jgi:hypothetical protein